MSKNKHADGNEVDAEERVSFSMGMGPEYDGSFQPSVDQFIIKEHVTNVENSLLGQL